MSYEMKSTRRNFGYQLMYRILAVITPFITSPILSRALGAEKLGIYSATLAYVNYFMLFAMLGVENYGNRSIAEVQEDLKRRQKLFWNIYAVQFCVSALAIAVYFITIAVLSQERKDIAALQGIWLLSCMLDINWFFFGCEQFKLTVTRNMAVKFATVISIAVFIRTPDDLLLYTIIMAGSTAVSQMVLWGSLRKFLSFERPCFQKMKAHILPVLQLFVPVLASSVFHIMDKSMLDWLSDEANVGFYYSADKMIYIPLGIITGTGTVMLPRMANILHNNGLDQARHLLKKSAELVTCLTAAIGFGIAAVAKEFVPVFFGEGFEPCITLLYCFVPVLFIKAWSDFIRSQYLIPAQKDRLYTASVICGAGVNLVCNYFLIIKYEAKGAVLGTLFAELTLLMVQLFFVNKEVNFMKYFLSQFHYILYGVLMFLAVRMCAGFIQGNEIIKLCILVVCGAGVYMICCFITWRFKTDSIFHGLISQFLRQLTSKTKKDCRRK